MSVICLISDDGKNIDITASYHPDDIIRNEFSNLLKAFPLNLNEGIIGQVIKTGLPLIVSVDGQNINSPGLFPSEYNKFFRKIFILWNSLSSYIYK